MSDEEDYMSLKFLEEAESFEKNRKETYSERRKRELREQKEKAYIKPLYLREEEKREKGLQTSMDSSNKGMQMLMKMGFKKGAALGNGGIVEPIKVDLKSDRMGLGMNSMSTKRLHEEEEELERKKAHIDVEDFRVMKARLNEENKRYRYLFAAVSVCQTFDEKSNVKSNILWLLKPEEKEEEIPEENTQVETTKSETVQAETVQAETVQAETVQAETVQAETVQAETVQAETVQAETVQAETVQAETVQAETVQAETVQAETVQAETVQAETVQAETVQAETVQTETIQAESIQIKNTQAENIEEKKEKEEEGSEKSMYSEEEIENLMSLSLIEKLERVIEYLRVNYFYCFWCRAAYSDEKDLNENCPGKDEEDH